MVSNCCRKPIVEDTGVWVCTECDEECAEWEPVEDEDRDYARIRDQEAIEALSEANREEKA